MKRRFTILTAALALLAFLAIPMGMKGQTRSEVTYTFSQYYNANTTLTDVAIAFDNNITGTFHKGTGSTAPQYYTNGTAVRWYGGNTLDITASNATISAIELTYTQKSKTVTTDVGTYDHATGIWSGSASSVTFTVESGSGHNRVSAIKVTYTISGGNPTCATPTFSPAAGTYTQAQNVSISCTTEDATIYYTTNGDDPTTNSTVYTEAISVSSEMTIKAMAAKSGYDNSAIATAEYAFITLNHAGTLADPYTVADAHTAIDANAGTQGVYATGIVSAIPDAWSTQYNNITFNFVDNEGDTDFLQAYRCVSGNGVDASTVAVGDVVVVYGNLIKYGSTYEFGTGCQLVSLTHPAVTTPSVTVTPATINAPAEGADGTLAIAYENIEDLISFDIQFCDANGNELEGDDPDWIYAEITEPTGDEGYTVSYIIDANDGEARNAYFKVYTFVGEELEEVYSNLVTISQEEYVAPTYATLPFEFNGGKTDIENTDGLYQEGLGTDYNASTNPNTQLKFDGTGDWLLLQFNERPGTLTFDIKGNSFNGGTFTVQTSENGTTYTDLATYTELSDVQNEEFTDLGENVRYIKWIYTNKASGNVGLGNITLAVYEAPQPSITFDPNVFDFNAEQHVLQIPFTYENIVVTNYQSFTTHHYNAEGQEIELVQGEAWYYCSVTGIPIGEGYQLTGAVIANEGEARSAYMKVSALDAAGNTVYSNLVTINQAAAPQQYTLTVEPFENLEIITFVNDEMVMEADGEIQVNEGAHIMLSIVADEGYVMETLMVNGVNHVNDIAADFTYEFDMPAEAVTISATAVEQVVPAGGDYVRITSLDQLTDGSIVVIAARYDEEHTNGYYAMSNATSGKPTGVLFTSTTSGDNEILPASIVDNEDDYYWVVNETENGFTFTNAEGFMIGYTSSTNFATGGNNTEWTIASYTASSTSMVPNYAGFKIVNFNQSGRAFALNESHNYGPYSTSNMNGNDAYKYNFSLDFFVQTEVETETYTLTVEGYGNSEKGGYYLIASPVTVDPENVEGMTEGNYDLYYFDQAEEDEWRNYKAETFNLEPGKGYLYAHKDGGNFTLTGTPYSGNGVFPLSYSEGENLTMKGWNLVGNPFAETAYIDRDYYTMNSDGSQIIAATNEDGINRMEGVFVKATGPEQSVTFSTTAPESKSATLALNLSQGRGVIDRAIVRFDEGLTLPKFQINRNSTKLYILQDNEEFAVVNSTAQGEMPVSFKAAENGRYTLSINNESVEMNYLHLIDNMTGTDIDLLQTPSYSFDANTTDYAQRFKLVFATGNADDYFAFFSNGNLVINNEGQATLQVVDITGRMISNTTISGCESIDLHNMNAGVYMIRLINRNDVKVQKVVVR